MSKPDLNLLFTLQALLEEGSVAKAARRLHLSASAMSRALARLRQTTGDPLLVRAGRGLVASPRAIELSGQITQLVQSAETALRPASRLDPKKLQRLFSLRTSEGFVENFGPALIARISKEAPGVKLCFVPKPDKDSASLRKGAVDLETGVVSEEIGPEIRTQALFKDRLIGVVRTGHALSRGKISATRFAAGRHIAVSRNGDTKGPVDDAVHALGLRRDVVMIVGGFATAVSLAKASDMIATVPEKHTGVLRSGMHSFRLPFSTAPFTVSMLWHPRSDADPGHRWLRECVRDVCSEQAR
ncbi:MAG: LysR family transcriptional regulator [Prosthecobacter sp.]|jgi:DNA-binding transcriptional LysR family regulator|uniref:LysR family transcriptional regulator n=1 Tax=Prosthecobacter sp. TaxID=1965333 RepID=UPI0019F732A2|nr:LysR family transcriptional regulator [Prosthecobacter sp.]MBE2286326.1 LysR family transcriptional regulator [Prosthecobacter sp.]